MNKSESLTDLARMARLIARDGDIVDMEEYLRSILSDAWQTGVIAAADPAAPGLLKLCNSNPYVKGVRDGNK
jgi:hypothetical protein